MKGAFLGFFPISCCVFNLGRLIGVFKPPRKTTVHAKNFRDCGYGGLASGEPDRQIPDAGELQSRLRLPAGVILGGNITIAAGEAAGGGTSSRFHEPVSMRWSHPETFAFSLHFRPGLPRRRSLGSATPDLNGCTQSPGLPVEDSQFLLSGSRVWSHHSRASQ